MYLSTPVSPYFCIPLYLYDCISLSLHPSCISLLPYPRPQYTFILLASCILLSLYSCIFVSQYCCNTLDCIPLSFYFVFLYPVECRLCPQNSLGWFLSDWAKVICQLYFYMFVFIYVSNCLSVSSFESMFVKIYNNLPCVYAYLFILCYYLSEYIDIFMSTNSLQIYFFEVISLCLI